MRLRTVSAALYNMTVQSAGIIASNVYREEDAPRYREGNRVLIGICVMLMAQYVLTKGYYMWRNKSRAKIWDAMSEKEQREYLETTTDEGNKRLDFRFAH